MSAPSNDNKPKNFGELPANEQIPVYNPKSFSELSLGEKIGIGAVVAAAVPAGLIYGTGKLLQKGFQKGREFYSEYQENKALAAQMKNLELRAIKDEEIRAAFDEAVDSAQVELDITAMRLNYMAERYTSKFLALLEHNVTIKILYGRGEDPTTDATAARLKKEFGKYPNFRMSLTDNHAKLFICDSKFIVVSSYNVLSKDGKVYDWGEAGLLTNAPSVIAGFRQDYFNF